MALTVNQINSLSYTQFVAYINQWNVPPGALDTINQWSVFGHVNEKSRILEIACTTGLSSREIARITGCTSKGIDLCSDSIETAKFNAEYYGKGLNLSYECADATSYRTSDKYSHLIIGASLGFFSNQNKMLSRLTDFFDESGYILASPYFKNEDADEMPANLIARCQKAIGITPTTMPYDQVRDIYAGFEVCYEKRCKIVLETKKQIEKYTKDTIQRACELRKITSKEVFDCMYDRLYEIKDVSNEMHRYQSYSVLVLRYLDKVYPNRFLELF